MDNLQTLYIEEGVRASHWYVPSNGVVRLAGVRVYWENGTRCQPVSSVMSRNRFQLLLTNVTNRDSKSESIGLVLDFVVNQGSDWEWTELGQGADVVLKLVSTLPSKCLQQDLCRQPLHWHWPSYQDKGTWYAQEWTCGTEAPADVAATLKMTGFEEGVGCLWFLCQGGVWHHSSKVAD